MQLYQVLQGTTSFLYCMLTQCGQDSLVFDGASFAITEKGEVAFEAKKFNASQEYISFNSGVFKNYSPHFQTISNNELAFKQIILGLRDYARRCGFKKLLLVPLEVLILHSPWR